MDLHRKFDNLQMMKTTNMFYYDLDKIENYKIIQFCHEQKPTNEREKKHQKSTVSLKSVKSLM